MKREQIIWAIIFICAGLFLIWRVSSSDAGRVWHYPVNHQFSEVGEQIDWPQTKMLNDGQGPAVTEYVIEQRPDTGAGDWSELVTVDVALDGSTLDYPSKYLDKDAPKDRAYRVMAKSGDNSELLDHVTMSIYSEDTLASEEQYIVHPEGTVGWTTWAVVKNRQDVVEPFRLALTNSGLDPALADEPDVAMQKISEDTNLDAKQRSMLTGMAMMNDQLSMSFGRTFGLWLSAFFTLCIMSFLYRDNPLYKFAEAVVVGASAAYVMAVGFWAMLVKNLFANIVPSVMKETMLPGMPIQDLWDGLEWTYLVPAVFIIFLLWRLMPFGGWISRWPLAFFIGITAGLRLIAFLEADFMAQIAATMIPLWVSVHDVTGTILIWDSIWASFSNIVIVFATLTGLIYFFFSVEHKGIVGGGARIGIWFLMITFGAGFGYTVMGRIALLSERLQYLFGNWLDFIDKV